MGGFTVKGVYLCGWFYNKLWLCVGGFTVKGDCMWVVLQ